MMRSYKLLLKKIADRLDPQSIIVSVFSFVMLWSLVASLSVEQGHAGGTIAETAQQIEPLRAGQQAPAFVVGSGH